MLKKIKSFLQKNTLILLILIFIFLVALNIIVRLDSITENKVEEAFDKESGKLKNSKFDAILVEQSAYDKKRIYVNLKEGQSFQDIQKWLEENYDDATNYELIELAPAKVDPGVED